MKRTGEVALGIVGAVVYAGLAFVGFFLRTISGNEELKQELITTMLQEDSEMTKSSANDAINAASGFGTYVIIVAIIAIILGIVAMVLLRGNKSPKAAGIILIVTGVVSVIATVFLAFLGGLFFLIAGIMALARKPSQPIEAQ